MLRLATHHRTTSVANIGCYNWLNEHMCESQYKIVAGNPNWMNEGSVQLPYISTDRWRVDDNTRDVGAWRRATKISTNRQPQQVVDQSSACLVMWRRSCIIRATPRQYYCTFWNSIPPTTKTIHGIFYTSLCQLHNQNRPAFRSLYSLRLALFLPFQ
jgi:hypothetical protein